MVFYIYPCARTRVLSEHYITMSSEDASSVPHRNTLSNVPEDESLTDPFADCFVSDFNEGVEPTEEVDAASMRHTITSRDLIGQRLTLNSLIAADADQAQSSDTMLRTSPSVAHVVDYMTYLPPDSKLKGTDYKLAIILYPELLFVQTTKASPHSSSTVQSTSSRRLGPDDAKRFEEKLEANFQDCLGENPKGSHLIETPVLSIIRDMFEKASGEIVEETAVVSSAPDLSIRERLTTKGFPSEKRIFHGALTRPSRTKLFESSLTGREDTVKFEFGRIPDGELAEEEGRPRKTRAENSVQRKIVEDGSDLDEANMASKIVPTSFV